MVRPSNRQIRAARALLGWDQTKLAERADVSKGVVTRIEAESTIRTDSLDAIVGVLEKAGIEFFEGGVKLRTPARR